MINIGFGLLWRAETDVDHERTTYFIPDRRGQGAADGPYSTRTVVRRGKPVEVRH
jgi:hypothetical protein